MCVCSFFKASKSDQQRFISLPGSGRLPCIVLSGDDAGRDSSAPCVSPEGKTFTDSGCGNQCFSTFLSIKFSIPFGMLPADDSLGFRSAEDDNRISEKPPHFGKDSVLSLWGDRGLPPCPVESSESKPLTDSWEKSSLPIAAA